MCSVCRRRPFLRISKQREADDDDGRPLYVSLFANTKCAMLFFGGNSMGNVLCVCVSFFQRLWSRRFGSFGNLSSISGETSRGAVDVEEEGGGRHENPGRHTFFPEPVDKDKIVYFPTFSFPFF